MVPQPAASRECRRAWPALAVAALLCPAAAASAGPREFGLAELERAFAERGAGPGTARLALEVRSGGPPESFEVTPGRVVGTDERGLMYGLLAAAEQVRTAGRIGPARGAPRTAIRGVRRFLHNEALEAGWYHSREQWDAYFAMLARNRFNLVLAHQTDYLAPPYPFLVGPPGFPEVRVPGLTAEERGRNLETLCHIAQAAADHAVDFALGVWEHDAPPWLRPTVVGLTGENVGPYSRAALEAVLERCPAIASVQVRTNAESGIPAERQVAFYRDHVFRALREAGRPVTLDLRGWAMGPGMLEAAQAAGIPLRLSAKYWAEHLGRPYQPAETYPGYGYLGLLRKPRRYGFFWELWGLGSHRLLLWGSPEHVRRAVGTFGLGGGEGFEIDPPLAQKGFGNTPGTWGAFTEAELGRRRGWTWEWERYWLFYVLWGRLSYDPGTPDKVWEDEIAGRFGAGAAPDVMEAYRNASEVLGELVAVNMPDPNMYLWPEVNPGGLVDAYMDSAPGDWRLVASVREAVADGLASRGSAKQGPAETAARLDRWAEASERAVARAGTKVESGNREWLSSEPDFLVLAALARYHARKQRGAEALALFDATGDAAALARARRELETALAVWEGLVRLTDGLYPEQMAFGPEDVGHWRDKLPYVRHDLRLVEDRETVLRRLGRFDLGLDFGGPVPEAGPRGDHRRDPFVVRNTVAPRFLPVDPGTVYDEARGYGWVGGGAREAEALAPTPYPEVRAVAKDPGNLPRDVLWRDSIRGLGRQTLAVRAGPGEHEVTILHADGTLEARPPMPAVGGRLEIAFPEGAWSVSGLVVRGPGTQNAASVPPATSSPPRPAMRHEPPAAWRAGEPLPLSLGLADAGGPWTVRLHHRPVDQLATFRTIEVPSGGQARFTVPGAEIAVEAGLMYYFEVLDGRGGGWFQPDPREATPYYVVTVTP